MTPIKSALKSITCVETIHQGQLRLLLNSSLLQTIPYNGFENERQQLIRYQKTEGQIAYFKPSVFGRVYATGAVGLQAIRKEIRHTLTYGLYVDVDIFNAHFEILHQVLKHNGYNRTKYIEKYVHDRENCLIDIMEKYNVQKDAAKALFIQLLYGGSFKNWSKSNNVTAQQGAFIMNFKKELDAITDVIVDKNPLVLKSISKAKGNIKGSVCSFFLQEYENRILESIYHYCVGQGYITDNDCVLCFDGIMIRADKFNTGLLTEFRNAVRDSMGFSLTFVAKDLSMGYTDAQLEASQGVLDQEGLFD